MKVFLDRRLFQISDNVMLKARVRALLGTFSSHFTFFNLKLSDNIVLLVTTFEFLILFYIIHIIITFKNSLCIAIVQNVIIRSFFHALYLCIYEIHVANGTFSREGVWGNFTPNKRMLGSPPPPPKTKREKQRKGYMV